MARLIPGKTKVQIELFKGISVTDIIVGGVTIALALMSLSLDFSGRFIVMFAILIIGGALVFKLDAEPTYVFLLHLLKHIGSKHEYSQELTSGKSKLPKVDTILPFTGISDNAIEYDGKYYGAVLEIPPVEFRFFSEHRKNNSIDNGVGRVLRSVNPDFGFNFVRLERPIIYDGYIENEYDKIEEIRRGYAHGTINEEELKARMDVIYDRITELENFKTQNKVIEGFYYIVLYAENKKQLDIQVNQAIESLNAGEINPKRLNDKQLAVFLRYSNEIDFDEREIDGIEPQDYMNWIAPQSVSIAPRTVTVNGIMTHNLRVVNYPQVVSNAWLASVMSIPGTKVVVKCKPMDNAKAVKGIDRALQELRGQFQATSIDSKLIEIQSHIDTLGTLLALLQGDNEVLFETSVYVTAYDISLTKQYAEIKKTEVPKSERFEMVGMKKTVRRHYQEENLKLNGMDFNQLDAFIASQVSAYDPMRRESRGIPSNTVAAMYPWIFAYVADKKGFKIGVSEGVPVLIDFFRRDSERVNSNMVIIGKSGSGKSYATKSLLANLAADDSKIFILDPENEYTELASNLHGKFINVGNAQHGRLNPFHIITALDDDEENDETTGSYATHLQFLEEFFKQVLPDCDKDAIEYLNSMIDRMYYEKGITAETDLSTLKPTDYPVFDDLYDQILREFQQTDNEYIRRLLRTLINYIAKFATGGRNSNIWNGPSTITTEENFTVFNFQSLLANRNGSVANAQMLLVLKYIDNEIIKNRDYNTKYGQNRKIVVVIDEAHVFIDVKFPVALDFMFQLAKRIRKYNGMQIVITQNIKDFVGSEEIARKSTAIINACQYSFIFSLAPNDMTDLCKLYEKAGGINESEQDQIISAPRGQAFTITSPTSRSSFKIVVPDDVVRLFSNPDYTSGYFISEEGQKAWEDFIAPVREEREAALAQLKKDKEAKERVVLDRIASKSFAFVEVDEEEADQSSDQAVESIIVPDEPEIALESINTEATDDQVNKQPRALNLGNDNTVVQGSDVSPQIIDLVSKLSGMIEAADTRNDRMVGELAKTMESFGQFRYETLLQDVSSMIDQKLKLERSLNPSLMTEPVQTPSDEAEETVAQPMGVEGAFNIFEEAAGYTEAEDTSGESNTEEQDGENDIMSLLDDLTESFSELAAMSRIDVMLQYDEEVTEITLEELAKHIAIHKIR